MKCIDIISDSLSIRSGGFFMPRNNSNDQLGAMLETAGRKLGISPDALRAALSDPKKAQQLVGEIDRKSGGKICSGGIESLEKMVRNNPQARKIYDDIIRGGKNG